MTSKTQQRKGTFRFGNWVLFISCGLCFFVNAIFLQHIFALSSENKRLRSELTFPSSVWPGLGVADHAFCPAFGASLGDSSEVSDDGAWVPVIRWATGTTLVAGILAISLLLHNLDRLPHFVNVRIVRVLGGLPPETTRSEDGASALSKLIAYRMDRWFSTNPYSKTLALLYLTVAMIVAGGLGIFALSSTSLDDAIWEAIVGVGLDWTFPSDANPEDHDTSLRVVVVRLMGLVISVGGMLVTALMLGIVSDAISDKVDQMKKGKSDVLETDHTLILGWSDKMFALLGELANANESIGGGAIVILSERDKEVMEEDINSQGIDLRGSRVVCRSGNPLLASDLNKVSVRSARSIVILAHQLTDDTSADMADACSLRIVMSLMSIQTNFPGSLRGHIVAEVCDIDNEPLLKMVAGSHRLETVVAHDVIGRLMIQSRRQPGLASVWEDLLGFEGNEFYLQSWPELTGRTFGRVLLSFPEAVPIGVLHVKGDIVLNPSDEYPLAEGDQVIVLAEDDDTYLPTAEPHRVGPQPRLPPYEEMPIKERILFLGWRRDMDDMIGTLDEFVVSGSELWLYSNVPLADRREILRKGGLCPEKLRNLKLIYDEEVLLGEATDRNSLARVRPERFSTVLILAEEDSRSGRIADADSHALATLLLVRDLQWQNSQAGSGPPEVDAAQRPWYDRLKHRGPMHDCMVISEILDSRTRHLISELNVGEYVMSNEIVSMALAMVSESAAVNRILKELFTEIGNELYVHSAKRYIYPREKVSFFDIVARARQRNEIVVGYKLRSSQRPILNPPQKHERNLTLAGTEQVVVLAEEDVLLMRALASSSGPLTPQSSRFSRVLQTRGIQRQTSTRQDKEFDLYSESSWMLNDDHETLTLLGSAVDLLRNSSGAGFGVSK
uniref:Ion channel pollux n=1 Tax=Tetraselmis sp. GSL018 TaxID=582737 RepID=A0A061QVV7_9CHLO|mmetsp:Transcript_13238/g.31339  ORF Transcript_13238/g.31339 Transcript_13238/m.31339 type:complete len:898 (+) Transcript_13238:178-2871(+)